ncbi:MAG: phosphate ABC transporter permease family protein, partial [Pseudomonadota bacterium]
MPTFWLSTIILVVAALGFVLGRQRALASAGGDARQLHSLPVYYGSNTLMKVIVPAFGVMFLWLLVQPLVFENRVSKLIPDSAISQDATIGLVMAEVRRTAEGLDNAVDLGVIDDDTASNEGADLADMTQRLKDAGQVVTNQITRPVLRAAQAYRSMSATSHTLMTVAVLLVALAGAAWGVKE